MGTSDETKPSKSDKPFSPTTPEQTGVHLYPDWAAMQAYYGPRVALPPYYGAAVSSGHAPPPYMWGPQPIIPPYGTPYRAVYSHAGVYGHPTVPITSPPVAVETPKKTSASEGNEGGLMKKLKSFDGLAMSIGNGNVDSGDTEVDQSTETEGSSYGDHSGEEKAGRKRGSEGMHLTCDAKTEAKEAGVAVDSPISGILPPVRASSFEVKNPVSTDVKKTATSSMQPGPIVPSEDWLQTERELKRERRKQSNRESARRSRLRKQAEAEELAKKVESLMAENIALKSEISRLTESSEKLRLENSSLMVKPDSVQRAPEAGKEVIGEIKENDSPPSDNTENFLSRINRNNFSAIPGRNDGEGESCERNSKKGTKLHQLLDSKPRTDVVAAG